MKYVYIALLLFVFYVGGMYESRALMMLFLAQAILLLFMPVLSYYLKKHLSISFAQKTIYAEKGLSFEWELRAENSGRLPVGRFLMRYTAVGNNGADMARGKAYGSADCGETRLRFSYTCAHCGIVNLKAYKLKVYDYLSLFSSKKKIDDELCVTVFPQKYTLKISTANIFDGYEEASQNSISLPGNNYDEVRQIREYRDGDSMRHIHWNQTARSGNLWVKEYDSEKIGNIRLLIDVKNTDGCSESDRDNFYTLLYALIRGLLNIVPLIYVCVNGIYTKEVNSDSQCRDLFAFLYRNTGADTENDDSEYENFSDAMWLTSKLEWYSGSSLIYKFSGDTLIEDISDRVFSI